MPELFLLVGLLFSAGIGSLFAVKWVLVPN